MVYVFKAHSVVGKTVMFLAVDFHFSSFATELKIKNVFRCNGSIVPFVHIGIDHKKPRVESYDLQVANEMADFDFM